MKSFHFQTRRFNQAGNYDLALRKSKNVRIFLQLALFVGTVMWIMGLIVVSFMSDIP